MHLVPIKNKHNKDGMWICDCPEGWIIPIKFNKCGICNIFQPHTEMRWKAARTSAVYYPNKYKITADLFYAEAGDLSPTH